MTAAARTIFVFGIYESVAGLIFLLVPNLALALFGLPTTDEVWIRLFGLILIIIGYFYLMAARTETTAFFTWTVLPRMLVLPVHLALVFLGPTHPLLLIFGLIDFLGAYWTKRNL